MKIIRHYYNKKHALRSNEDWHGNNIAAPCPVCGQTYITSGLLDKGGRLCPKCQRSHTIIDPHGTRARVEWDSSDDIQHQPKKDTAA